MLRCFKQFGHVRKRKTYIHKNKRTSLFQITEGYNQWCPQLHTVRAIPSIHTSNSFNKHNTGDSLKKKKVADALEEKTAGALEEKAVDLKKKKKKLGDKGKRHNEKKTRRKGGGEKDGDRGERKKEKQMRKLWRQKEKEKRMRSWRRRANHPHSRNASPSQVLGNNMTPIKGRLGKNTTPTRRNSEKLIQRHQKNPSEGHRTLSIHLLQTSSARYGKQKSSKRVRQKGNGTPTYRESTQRYT